MLSKPTASFLIFLAILLFGQLLVPAAGAQAARIPIALHPAHASPPAVPFKSPVMQRVWKANHNHRQSANGQAPGTLPSPFLTTPPGYAAGTSPFDIALGDFNSDGKKDVIVAADPPVLLLGNGDGTLQAAASIGTIASAPTGVAVADFNRDGKLDVAFAISGGAVVYLGKGNGTFGPGTTFSSGGANQNGFARILVADVNNDGIADLILNTDAGVSVLLGKGNGTFRAPISSPGTVLYMSAADFNKDGNVDLAVTDGFRTLSILLGNGAGTFAAASSYPATEQNLNAIAIADYNRDGFPDVALPNGQIFLGNGDGTLRTPGWFPTTPLAVVVAAADVNGDGIPDLLTLSVSVFCGASDFGTTGASLGNGDGTFQPVTVFDSGGCLNPVFLAVGDLNNDGAPDIIAFSAGSPQLSVLINTGTGTFPAAILSISGGSGGVAVDDFNDDGNPDVVLSDGSVYLGNGDGTIRFKANASLGAIAVTTGDFNHDGNPDLAAAVECAPAGCSSGGQFLIAAGNGDGTFQPSTALPSGGFYAESLVVADFNHDGKLDVALVNNCMDSACSVGGSVSIYLGNGNGTFTLLNTINLPSGNPSSIVAGDFNNDGATDLAVGFITPFGQPSIVNTLLGNGDGSFQSPIVTEGPEDDGITAVSLGDFNKDGILDLVLANGAVCADCGGHGTIMYGNGDGTFVAGPGIGTDGGPPQSVVAADFYGTGTLTSVLANRCGDVLDCPSGSVMIDGTLNQTDIMLLFLAVGDFNNDGKPDLVGSLQYDAGASVLLNIGATAAATTTTIYPSAPRSYSAFQPAIFTVQVQHTGPGIPTGTVEFVDGGVGIGSAPVDSSGQASFRTTALAVGSHFVVAYYPGDTSFAPSNSLGVHVTINKATTKLALTSSRNPSAFGQPVAFTATIAPQYGGQASGSITFKDGAKTLGSATVSGNIARLAANGLAIGSHFITAVYSGDVNFSGSTSKQLCQVVGKAASTTTLTSSQNPSQFGQPVTFTATVKPQFSGTPTGTMVFKDGTKTLKSVPLNGGTASLTTSTLASGTHSITATYSGNSEFTASSAALTQTVH
ncbi:MAG: FG-GAP-like repeat-containing protein [Candidatus Sulfotelmatobacter sp.]